MSRFALTTNAEGERTIPISTQVCRDNFHHRMCIVIVGIVILIDIYHTLKTILIDFPLQRGRLLPPRRIASLSPVVFPWLCVAFTTRNGALYRSNCYDILRDVSMCGSWIELIFLPSGTWINSVSTRRYMRARAPWCIQRLTSSLRHRLRSSFIRRRACPP